MKCVASLPDWGVRGAEGVVWAHPHSGPLHALPAGWRGYSMIISSSPM